MTPALPHDCGGRLSRAARGKTALADHVGVEAGISHSTTRARWFTPGPDRASISA
ncbi:MAG TPA: hypothetical protein VH594_27585 [Trebonia sp.]